MKKISYYIIALIVAALSTSQYAHAQVVGGSIRGTTETNNESQAPEKKVEDNIVPSNENNTPPPAQPSLRDRLSKKQSDKQEQKGTAVPRMTVRAEQKNEDHKVDLSAAPWMREIYKVLDLTKGTNGALNYPATPVDGRMNLITMIFKLMAQGHLVAYEFPMNGMEVFNEQAKVNFGEILEKLEVPFEKSGDQYTFNEMDLPTNEMFGYYLKETWYFNNTNALGAEVVAICPVLDRVVVDDIDLGAGVSMPTSRVPLFWIPYENLRPYAARMPIMTSNYNNTIKKTMDDYFTLRLYDGEIYKTTNLENKILQEMYDNEDDLKAARKRIQTELETFEKGLWDINDSIKAEQLEQYKTKMEKQKKKKGKPKKRDGASSGSSSSGAKYSARDRR